METKDLRFKLFDINESEGVFKGYASIFDVIDSYNEIVERGAFKNTLRESDGKFPLCWFHKVNEPLGIVYAREDPGGLWVEGHLNLDVQAAREKRSLMKQGAVKGLSIGFKTIKDQWDKDIRRLTEIKLFEVSPITLNFQACPGAEIEDVKQDAFLELLDKYQAGLLELKSLVMASEEKARKDFQEMIEKRQRYFEELSEIHHKINREYRR